MSSQGVLNEHFPMRTFTGLLLNLNYMRHSSNFNKTYSENCHFQNQEFSSSQCVVRGIETISYIICILQFCICFLDCTGRGENFILVLKPSLTYDDSLHACYRSIQWKSQLYLSYYCSTYLTYVIAAVIQSVVLYFSR